MTIVLLVALEGLLSADNAMVLAVLVLSLPKSSSSRPCDTASSAPSCSAASPSLLAVYLIQLAWVKLVGGRYLLCLLYQHFFRAGEASEGRRTPPQARAWLGFSRSGPPSVKVEMTDLVFAIDSILVAVAMSPKLWVILTGGILGIIAMRLVIGQLLALIERYPALVDGAFIIIAWVGIKLLIEFLHAEAVIDFEIPQWLSLGLIVVIFAIAFFYARRHGQGRAAGTTRPRRCRTGRADASLSR